MACRMTAVGCVTVSERKSIREEGYSRMVVAQRSPS